MAEFKVKLLIVQGKPAGKSFSFPCGDYFIGRGPECHIRPDSELVSRQHCRLRVVPELVSIRDLGSTNGTLVNGLLVDREQQLSSGDQVQIGPLVFEVQVDMPAGTGGAKTVKQEANETTEIEPQVPNDAPSAGEPLKTAKTLRILPLP